MVQLTSSPRTAGAVLERPAVPALAQAEPALPAGVNWSFEPKWDGFRALIDTRGRRPAIWSRSGNDLARFFPELVDAARHLPPDTVVDGEVVLWVVADDGVGRCDFDALLRRLTPSRAQAQRLATASPVSYVAFDLLMSRGRALTAATYDDRRAALVKLLGAARPPLHLTPATTDRAEAQGWLRDWTVAGVEGVVAKRRSETYQAGARRWCKVKEKDPAEFVVVAAAGSGAAVRSLVLGARDTSGRLRPVAVTSRLSRAVAAQAAARLRPAEMVVRVPRSVFVPLPGVDQDPPVWVGVEPDQVVEVAVDTAGPQLLSDGRVRPARHAVSFVRWRPDIDAADVWLRS